MTASARLRQPRVLLLNYEYPPLGGGAGIASAWSAVTEQYFALYATLAHGREPSAKSASLALT